MRTLYRDGYGLDAGWYVFDVQSSWMRILIEARARIVGPASEHVWTSEDGR